MQTPILDRFLNIPQSEIDQELTSHTELDRKFRKRFFRNGRPRWPENAEEEVLLLHFYLLFASAMQASGKIPFQKIFEAATSAAEKVSFSVMVSGLDKGRLGELEARQEAMRQEAGFTGFLGWPAGEGPAEYEALCEESGSLMTSVHDTVLVDIYRRYGLENIGTLYETDFARYQALEAEIGRRESPAPEQTGNQKVESDTSTLENLLVIFGPNILNFLKHYVRACEGARHPTLRRAFVDYLSGFSTTEEAILPTPRLEKSTRDIPSFEI